MGKLYETFTKIESGRKKCIDSLRARNILINNDANFDAIAESIRYATDGLDVVKDQHMWQRPEEWIDTENLLLNAPVIDGYTAFAVYLLYDQSPTMDLKLSPASSSYYAYDAYYLSDGTIYTTEKDGTNTITHTWDKTKDIDTTLGYKLRYAIEYVMNNKIEKMDNYYSSVYFGDNDQLGIGKALLEVTARNLSTNIHTALEIPNCIKSSTIISNVERIHILDSETQFSRIYTYNTYFGIKEYQVDHVGSFTYNFYEATSRVGNNSNVINNMKVLLPNVTELLCGSGSSNDYLRATYLYAPELITINNNGNYQYGEIYVNYLIAPKLKTINKDTALSRNTIQYLPSLSSTNNVRYYYMWYKEELFSRITDVVAALPSSQTNGMCYNETIEELTNTKNQSNYFTLGVDLPNLKKIAVADTFKSTSSTTDTTWFVVGKGFKSSLNISNMNYLPGVYLHMLINNLADVTGEEEIYTLSLGSTLLSKLSDEEKAIATNKGWVLE